MKKTGLFLVLIFTLGQLYAQTDQIVEDFNTYVANFSRPFVSSYAWGQQNGWYNTANPHETLGFDLTIRGTLLRVPDGDFFFDFIPSDYNNISTPAAQLATLLGPETSERLTLSLTDDNTGTAFQTNIDAPGGIQSSLLSEKYVPVPMIQLGIGVVKNTELIVRYAPSIKIDQFSLTFFGIGVKHDWKQWVPVLKDVPIDMSLLVAYTNFNTEVDIDTEDFAGTDQMGSFDTGSWTFQALVSKEISVLTVYGGFGYNISNSDVKVTGTYILDNGPFSTSLTDPVSQSFSNNGLNATFGLRLKFAILTFHGDYTFQEYNAITAGIGFSFR